MRGFRTNQAGGGKNNNSLTLLNNADVSWVSTQTITGNRRNTKTFWDGSISLGLVSGGGYGEERFTSALIDFSKYDFLIARGSVLNSGASTNTTTYNNIFNMYILDANEQVVTTLATSTTKGNSVTSPIDVALDVSEYNFKGYIRASNNGYAPASVKGYSTVSFTRFGLYSEKDYRKYLYKYGTQDVAWDNTGYRGDSGHPTQGGFTLNDYDMSVASVSDAYGRSIITNNAIDVTDYSKIKAEYNNGQIRELDISSAHAMGYIALWVTGYGGNKYFNIAVGRVKEDFNTNAIVPVPSGGNTGSGTLIVTRVWLEK